MGSSEGRRGVHAGTLTLVLGDVEGSTRRWATDRAAMAESMAVFNELIKRTVSEHGGVRPIEQGEGDSFLAIFPRATDALSCAISLQRSLLADAALRVRMGLHTGEIDVADDRRCSGDTVNRCARIRDLAHGAQILLSRPACDLVIDRLPADITLLDLGSHRLRDPSRPEQLYQVCHPELPVEFPALHPNEPRHNIPASLSSFVGRGSELAELSRVLPDARVLTLTGAGGCGKTRLAMRVASDVVNEYPDGAWWVDLGPLSDPGLVPSAVASAISVKELPHEDIVQTMRRYLKQRSLLLVLDNCEHLATACAAVAADIAQTCPGVTVLATSREPLGISGEITWRVPSLPFPAADDVDSVERLERFDAVKLFVERARRMRPSFVLTPSNAEAVLRICRRLDGIPLALELAAAQVRVLGPEQIARGLGESFGLLTGSERVALPRQRTLEASVEWSYRLLAEKERVLLTRLSVFAGGFSLEAAETVCEGDPIDPYEILDLLTRLVDKSLVNVEESSEEIRYSLLETVRDYARRRLFDSDDATTFRNRHLDFFVERAQQLRAMTLSSLRSEAVSLIELDYDNLRAALDWVVQSGDVDKGCLIVGALHIFWTEHGHMAEGRIRSETVLGLDGASPEPRMRALVTHGNIALVTGELDACKASCTESLRIAREIDSREFIGISLDILAWTASFDDPDVARSIVDEATAFNREHGDPYWLADALAGAGNLEHYRGNLSKAREIFEEAADVARRSANRGSLSESLCLLGHTEIWAGDFEAAERHLREALDVAREIGATFWEALALDFTGELALFRGDHIGGERLITEASTLGTDGGPFAVAAAAWRRAELNCDRHDLDAASRDVDEALEFLVMLGVGWGAALARSTKGDIAELRGDRQLAAEEWNKTLEMAEASLNGIAVGRAKHRLARAACWEGAFRRAEELLHEALASQIGSGSRIGIIDVLEGLAALASSQDSFTEAARIFGAAQAARDDIGYGRLPGASERYKRALDDARDRMGDVAFDAAWVEGQRLSLDEILTFVRKRRGSRKRPPSGWDSLTPMEVQVAGLVGEGLTNPQIAEKLCITAGTVKVHVSHIFRKLGVRRRAELASETTRRSV